jgi:signal transduction histidine kinase
VLFKEVKKENLSHILIEVIDVGIGISELEQSKIFEPFFRTENSDSKKMNPSGNGLGLNISKNIAQCLKGDLTCKSTIGKGSTFSFIFEA